MAKIELGDFDTYLRQLDGIKDNIVPMCKAIVYPGAKVLADAMRAEVEALPTISDVDAINNWRAGLQNPALSDSQKAGLVESLGITPITKDSGGMVQASVGFTGYNSVTTRHFPGGQPNQEVARSLEHGTSGLKRDAFATRAVRKARAAAEAAMAAEADAQIEKRMKENA